MAEPLSFDTICPYCSRPTRIVWVHGHGQCEHCTINIDECCRGECCAPVHELSNVSLPTDRPDMAND